MVLFTLVHAVAGRSLLSQRCIVPVRPVSLSVTDELRHIGVVPEMVPPTDSGLTVTLRDLDCDGQRGSLVYLVTTLTVLVPADPPISTVICLVPWPEVIVHPAGTVQTYSVVPPYVYVGGSLVTENTWPVAFIQTSDGPEIEPGLSIASLMVRSIFAGGPSQPLTPLVSVT